MHTGLVKVQADPTAESVEAALLLEVLAQKGTSVYEFGVLRRVGSHAGGEAAGHGGSREKRAAWLILRLSNNSKKEIRVKSGIHGEHK